MAIELIDKIKPKNGGNFPMVDAEDVLMPGGLRLSEYELSVESAVGIQSVQQTTVAQGDGAENVFTVTLTDGRTTDLVVKNGSKGSTGQRGEQGIQGEQGVRGEKGDKGDKGDTGAAGQQGEKGDPGQQGEKGESGEDGGYYTPGVTQPNSNTLRISFAASKEGMPSVSSKDITLPSSGGGGGMWSEIEILAEQTKQPFAYSSALGVFAITDAPASFVLKDGESYTVVWDSKEHERTAFAFVFADGSQCVGVGNPLAAGQASNGDMFCIVHDVKHNYMHYLSLDQESSHTVAIYQTIEDVLATESFVKKYVDEYIREALEGEF